MLKQEVQTAHLDISVWPVDEHQLLRRNAWFGHIFPQFRVAVSKEADAVGAGAELLGMSTQLCAVPATADDIVKRWSSNYQR
jgi:hypothetical protein